MASTTTETGDGAESAPAPATAPLKPSLPWKTRLAVSLISSLSDTARRPDGTINRRLLNFLDIKATPSPSKPIRSIISSDVVVDPTPSRKLWFRVYTPVDAPTTTNLPVIIFFHGGGFSFLSAATKSYDIVCRRFARTTPAIVISVEYRLTPEHRFPSQYDDGFDVLKFLDDQIQSSSSSSKLPANADVSKCFLAGDSAGANLAHHVAVRACRSADQFRTLKVIGLVSIQPFFGGQERTESETRQLKSVFVSVARTDWLWKVFLPEGCDRDHYAVNVSGPNAEDIRSLENFPETMVVVGGCDPLQDWQRRYYEWLKRSEKEACLIEYPTMIHAFYVFPELPESSQLFSHVKEFVARRLAKV